MQTVSGEKLARQRFRAEGGDEKGTKWKSGGCRGFRGERRRVYTRIEMYPCICIPTEGKRKRERSPRRHGDRIDPHGPRRYVRNDSQLANSILER